MEPSRPNSKARFSAAPLIGAEAKRNPDPAPITADEHDKPKASCNHCGYAVVWDQFGFEAMQKHMIEKHPERI